MLKLENKNQGKAGERLGRGAPERVREE